MSGDAPIQQPAAAAGAARRWIIIGAVIAAIALAVALVLHFRDAPKIVKGSELSGLLLGDQQLSGLIGGSVTSGKVSEDGSPTPGGLSKANCLSAMDAAQALSYTDSGYTDLHWSQARDNAENVQHYVAQAVAAFPSAEQAQAYVANAAAEWRLCADQTVVTVQPDQPPVTWRLVGVVGVPPKVSISKSREDTKWTCQRALRAAANVVVDVTACGAQISDQGRKIGDAIAANVVK